MSAGSENIAERLQAVRSAIAEACRKSGRSPREVTLVAASKTQAVAALGAAVAAGQRDFGENYAQELDAKRRALSTDVHWHMIGHLQRNTVRHLLDGECLLHTLDSERLGQALERAAVAQEKRVRCLIEVNIAMEPSKAGVLPEALPPLLEALGRLRALEIDGLMCIPAPENSRRWFESLRELRESAAAASGLALATLSMGMSADFEDAILEGATIVRVGTAIFGARPGSR